MRKLITLFFSSNQNLAIDDSAEYFGVRGAQGGIRTRSALDYTSSSVARVTAVHTLGRLPLAADRAILPQRVRLNGRGASPEVLSWATTLRESYEA